MKDQTESAWVSAHSLEMMLVRELGGIDGCVGIRSIRLAVDKDGSWRPVAIDFGKADELLCMETLQTVIPGYQRRYRIKQ
jgi:hypothetical protein